MNFLTALIPAPYRWLVLAALLAAFGAFSFVKGAQHEQRKDEARQAKLAQQQLHEQIASEHRKQDAVKEITDDLRKQVDPARAAGARNRAAGQRLRDQLAACLLPQPGSAGGSPSADPAGRVLADVQRRLAEAEDATVEFADASRRAGLGCERAYDAVKPKD